VSWLTPWLKQSVSWEARTASDSWEGDTYADAATILARKEESRRESSGPGGLEIRQTNLVWVEEDVAVGDKIDDEIVQGRNSLTDMDGATVGYELRTEP
jgi:hypothetical protein